MEGHRFRGHKGSIRGFIATTAYSPELRVGYFVSLNKLNGGINEISSLIVKFLTAGKPAKSAPVVELNAVQKDQILGYYLAATPRTQLTNFIYSFLWLQQVWEKDGRLFRTYLIGRHTEELLPVSGNSFRLASEPVATLFLVRDAQGQTFLQSGHEGHLRKTSGYAAWGQILA